MVQNARISTYLVAINVHFVFSNRMESDDEDAPESIIPASSPESNVGDDTPRFPQLREPKEEETERAISPIIPLIPRTAIPGIKQHFDSADQHDQICTMYVFLRYIHLSIHSIYVLMKCFALFYCSNQFKLHLHPFLLFKCQVKCKVMFHFIF